MSREQNHITVVDDLQREVTYRSSPRRVASLCPSLTETLFDLGLGERVVARTEYCIHPADRVRDVPTVGGVKNFDVNRLIELAPDLVIAAKEENPRELVEQLSLSRPVYVFDVVDYDSSLRAIETLGRLTGVEARAEEISSATRAAFDVLKPAKPRRAAYLIWREPYVCVGAGTYIHSMMTKCRLDNACAGMHDRYPEITIAKLRELTPDWIMLSSEPYPFDQTNIAEIARLIPEASVMLVDGEMFAWYGARMRAASSYFQTLTG